MKPIIKPIYFRSAIIGIVAAVVGATGVLARRDTNLAHPLRALTLRLKAAAKPTPEGTPISAPPSQTSAPRVRIVFGEKHQLKVATGVDSFVTVNAEIADVERAGIPDRAGAGHRHGAS